MIQEIETSEMISELFRRAQAQGVDFICSMQNHTKEGFHVSRILNVEKNSIDDYDALLSMIMSIIEDLPPLFKIILSTSIIIEEKEKREKNQES